MPLRAAYHRAVSTPAAWWPETLVSARPGARTFACVAVALCVLVLGAPAAAQEGPSDAGGGATLVPDPPPPDAASPEVSSPETTPSEATAEASRADVMEEPAGEPIAVLLLPSGSLDASIADALTELLIAAVAERVGGRIVGKEEFQAQLGQGDASTVECIESMTCLGRVGVALGVHEVIAGTIGRRGDRWAFSVNRIDVRTGHIEGRVFREVEGDLAAVVRALPQSVDDLYVDAIEPGRLVVRADVDGAEVSLDGVVVGTIEGTSPVRRDLVPPGPHEVVVSARGRTPYRRAIDIEPGTTFALEAQLEALPQAGFEVPWPTWVFGGLAIASLATGIGVGVSSTAIAPGDTSMRGVQAFYAARANEAIAADVLFACAVAATAGAIVPLILELTSPRAPATTVSVQPGLGGATLVVGGRF